MQYIIITEPNKDDAIEAYNMLKEDSGRVLVFVNTSISDSKETFANFYPDQNGLVKLKTITLKLRDEAKQEREDGVIETIDYADIPLEYKEPATKRDEIFSVALNKKLAELASEFLLLSPLEPSRKAYAIEIVHSFKTDNTFFRPVSILNYTASNQDGVIINMQATKEMAVTATDVNVAFTTLLPVVDGENIQVCRSSITITNMDTVKMPNGALVMKGLYPEYSYEINSDVKRSAYFASVSDKSKAISPLTSYIGKLTWSNLHPTIRHMLDDTYKAVNGPIIVKLSSFDQVNMMIAGVMLLCAKELGKTLYISN